MRKFHLSIPRDISISAYSCDQARGSPSAPADSRNSNINTQNPKLENQLLHLRNFAWHAQCEFRISTFSSFGSSAVPALSPTRS